MNENVEELEDSKKIYENPQNMRYGNLVMKNVPVFFVILVAVEVYLKWRKQLKRTSSVKYAKKYFQLKITKTNI